MSLSKQQFLRNSAWTFAELTLYPVLMLLATPVFISKLGIEQYGLWMLVATITLGINVLNIGVGETTIRLISQYRAEGSLEKIREVFRYNFSLAIFLCCSALLVGVVFYLTNFIGLFYNATDYGFANRILLMASISAGLKFIEIAVLSVFKAFERFDLNSRLNILSKNTVVLASLFLVVMGKGLEFILMCTLAINLLNLVVQLLVLSNFNEKVFCWPTLGFFKHRSEYSTYNFWYWLQASIALLGFLTDKLAVAWFTDMKTMGYYSIASMIGTNIHNFFLAFGGFIFPRVSFKMANKRDLAPLYFVARGLIALPGWLIIGFLVLGGDFIFRLWLGQETYTNSIFYIKLYLVFEAGMLLIIVPFHFINGTKQIQLNSLFEVVIRSSHFILMLGGYYLAGVSGILYGLICSTAINIPFQYLVFHKKIITSVNGQQYLVIILPVLLMLGAVVSENLVFKGGLVLALLFCAKIIYFDPALKHIKEMAGAQKLAG